MSEVDYQEIKKWLGHGGLTQLARDAGKSKQGMSFIFSAKSKKPNVEILKKACQIALKNQNEILTSIAKMRENSRLIDEMS